MKSSRLKRNLICNLCANLHSQHSTLLAIYFAAEKEKKARIGNKRSKEKKSVGCQLIFFSFLVKPLFPSLNDTHWHWSSRFSED
jgi:hypothetical protein